MRKTGELGWEKEQVMAYSKVLKDRKIMKTLLYGTDSNPVLPEQRQNTLPLSSPADMQVCCTFRTVIEHFRYVHVSNSDYFLKQHRKLLFVMEKCTASLQ
jgi:hypothetical protein